VDTFETLMGSPRSGWLVASTRSKGLPNCRQGERDGSRFAIPAHEHIRRIEARIEAQTTLVERLTPTQPRILPKPNGTSSFWLEH
jgi:hypothetical protein